ncbi:MAG: transketolase family protein [Candidatus Omnitrophica bacterium]|nr:transketolase family protein [Candidatus Omnitrophota bacterium]
MQQLKDEKFYARDVYGKTLVELGKIDPNLVVLDADLSGSTRTSFFAREFPERFINFGVAEQNMMAHAAGLASCGKIVFVSTFAMFASARALDQVRNTIIYNKFNVKIVATHGGITVGEDGASHQALEDINFFRAIPYITIINPSDAWEARDAIIAAHKTPGPFYIRLGRSKIATIPNKPEFKIGKGFIIEEGNDLAIIANGIMVNEALAARKLLKDQGVSAAVVNMPTVKPIDSELIVDLAKKYRRLLVCEEHQITGGLYSAVCEVTSLRFPVLVHPVGVDNKFGQSGSPEELVKFYGLSSSSIAEKAQQLLRQKN